MRWVKEILPPRVRFSWLLMTMRLSASSFAGTARTLVAVGTASEAFMFLTTALAAPRIGRTSSRLSADGLAAALEVLPAAGFAAGGAPLVAARSPLRRTSVGSAGLVVGVLAGGTSCFPVREE